MTRHYGHVAIAFLIALLLLVLPYCALATTFVSDTFVGSNLGQFRYTGRWEHVRKMGDGRVFGSSSRTSETGASITLVFIGRVVRIYGVRGPGGGQGSVTIDDGQASNVDFYSPEKESRRVVYNSALLPAGKHSITIRAAGAGSTQSRHRRYINISGAAYQ